MIARLRSRMHSWLRSLTGQRRLASEMDEELRFHIQARADDLAREGLSPSEAMRQARIEFGSVAAHKDGMRRSLGLRWTDELVADLRYGLRILRNSPGFTAIAVLSLGLAIGANTTIFSLANELLYARLGVPHPEQLRLFTVFSDDHSMGRSTWGSNYSAPGGGEISNSFTYPIYRQLQRQNTSLSEIFAFKENSLANVTIDGAAQSVQVELVSGNLYQQLQVRPILGRPIQLSDDRDGVEAPIVLISYSFWQRAFGGSADVIGKVITVNTRPVTIIGVNPASFTGAVSVQSSPELFMPIQDISMLRAQFSFMKGTYITEPSLWWVQLMARTRPGVSDQQAQVALDTALNAAVLGTLKLKKDETVPSLRIEDGSRGLNSSQRQFAKPLNVLLTFVGLVLLLACANIANLMLARATMRQREMGVRLALGAGRARILRQVLTESLLLSGMGGILGLMLGYIGSSALPRLMFSPWEQVDIQVTFDWRVFAFTAAVTLVTGILFGLAPAWAATRTEIGTTLKDGGKSATRRRKSWSGRSIVAFQLALSTLLVVGAGLFLRTLAHLNSIDPGFRTSNLVLFDINPPSQRYPAPKDVALHMQIEDALRAIPGIDGVTLSDMPLLADSQSNSDFKVEGVAQQHYQRGQAPASDVVTVGRDFLSILKIPIVAGRNFTQQDADSPDQSSIITQTVAKKYFPNQNPLGRRFSMDDSGVKDRTWLTIVGVSADIRYAHIKDEPPPLHFDLYRQAKRLGGVTYMLHTSLTPAALAPSIRAVLQRIDPDLPVLALRTQQQQIDSSMQQERTFAALTSGFGLLALALACVGIYGIMAYTVSQRTNEIGIRLALGAERGQVRAMVLREAGWLAISGIVIGLVAALLLGRLVKSMLYGLQPADPIALLSATTLLIAVALIAGWIPAARASRVEPMEALRHD